MLTRKYGNLVKAPHKLWFAARISLEKYISEAEQFHINTGRWQKSANNPSSLQIVVPVLTRPVTTQRWFCTSEDFKCVLTLTRLHISITVRYTAEPFRNLVYPISWFFPWIVPYLLSKWKIGVIISFQHQFITMNIHELFQTEIQRISHDLSRTLCTSQSSQWYIALSQIATELFKRGGCVHTFCLCKYERKIQKDRIQIWNRREGQRLCAGVLHMHPTVTPVGGSTSSLLTGQCDLTCVHRVTLFSLLVWKKTGSNCVLGQEL